MLLDRGATATQLNAEDGEAGPTSFTPPTTLALEASCSAIVEADGDLRLTNGSTLHLHSSSALGVIDESRVVVEKGCTLVVEKNASIYVESDARIVLEPGAMLLIGISPGVPIEEASVINYALESTAIECNATVGFIAASEQVPEGFYGGIAEKAVTFGSRKRSFWDIVLFRNRPGRN